MATFMAVGKIRSSHGVHGELKFFSFSGEYEHFSQLSQVELRQGSLKKDFQVESFRLAGEIPLLKLAGIDTPELAKTLANWEIWVERDKAAKLEPGEVYLGDLIGCRAVDGDKVLGTVTGYLEGGVAPLIEVAKTEGGTALVPFQQQYWGDIDLTGQTMQLLTPWILE